MRIGIAEHAAGKNPIAYVRPGFNRFPILIYTPLPSGALDSVALLCQTLSIKQENWIYCQRSCFVAQKNKSVCASLKIFEIILIFFIKKLN